MKFTAEVLDKISDGDSKATDSVLMQESLAINIGRALKILPERERDVIRLSFEIGVPAMTLEEIGDRFNLTRERVRQIREKAIRKMKGNEECIRALNEF